MGQDASCRDRHDQDKIADEQVFQATRTKGLKGSTTAESEHLYWFDCCVCEQNSVQSKKAQAFRALSALQVTLQSTAVVSSIR